MPTQADISFALALLPEPSLAGAISRASLAVSAQFENLNRIDERMFPAHLSLYLGGMHESDLPAFVAAIGDVVSAFGAVDGEATTLYTDARGFVGLRCRADGPIGAFHRSLVDACAARHRRHPVYRPRVLGRWGHLSLSDQGTLEQYGASAVLRAFDPHFSIARVGVRDLPAAVDLVRPFLPTLIAFRARALQLVDIGHQNESWRVLHAWEL